MLHVIVEQSNILYRSKDWFHEDQNEVNTLHPRLTSIFNEIFNTNLQREHVLQNTRAYITVSNASVKCNGVVHVGHPPGSS